MPTQKALHWLDRYANNAHAWTPSSQHAAPCFKRPIGIVESLFDHDGVHHGGRADMTITLKLEIRHKLPKADFRKRIAAAWTLLRLKHVLLMSRTEDEPESGKRCFVVEVPSSSDEALQVVGQDIVWLEDFGFDETLDYLDLHHHALNVERIIHPEQCLSKLHILPLKPTQNGTFQLDFLIVIAHDISDGLTAYNWFTDFLSLLNTPMPNMLEQISTCISADEIQAKLPPAQEDLYPRVPGSPARQRWFWAIMRVLRHVQKPMAQTFANPLRRDKRLDGPISLRPTYSPVFNYDGASLPPMSSAHVSATLSPAASARLIKLCKSVNVSVGAGCFALAGLSMMTMYFLRYGHDVSPVESAMGASFPLNPRPFLSSNPRPESCMLAFSEGIVMPFLSCSLPIETRFRLIARCANRGLRVYQKRVAGGSRNMGSFDKYSPARLLATGYLAHMERLEDILPPGEKTGRTPQGMLKPNLSSYGATCGVSSVGSVKSFLRMGEYDLNDETKDFVADYRGLKMGVRARDNEFLVGSSTGADGSVGFSVSYDENAVSQEMAQKWADTIEGLLEPTPGSRL